MYTCTQRWAIFKEGKKQMCPNHRCVAIPATRFDCDLPFYFVSSLVSCFLTLFCSQCDSDQILNKNRLQNSPMEAAIYGRRMRTADSALLFVNQKTRPCVRAKRTRKCNMDNIRVISLFSRTLLLARSDSTCHSAISVVCPSLAGPPPQKGDFWAAQAI